MRAGQPQINRQADLCSFIVSVTDCAAVAKWILPEMTKPFLPALFTGLLLAGCASPPAQAPMQSTAEIVDLPLPAVEYRRGELNRELLTQLLLAEMSGHAGLFDQALEIYLQQSELTGDAAVAARTTHIARFMRDSEAVIRAARIWAEADTEAQEPRHLLAGILLHERRFDEALPLLPHVLQETDNEYSLLLASQLELMPADTAERYLVMITHLLDAQPQRDDLLLVQGLLYKRSGDPEQAIRTFQRGLQRQPHQPHLSIQAAELLRQQGKIEPALNLIRQARTRHPDHQQLTIQYAQLLMLSGDGPRAERAMQQALRNHPDDDELQLYFALLLLEHERHGSAEEMLRELLNQGSRQQEAAFYLGHIAQLKGQRDQALAWYLSVTEGATFMQARARALELLNAPQYRRQAEHLIRDARLLMPSQDATLSLMLAEWLHTHGFLDEALQRLNQALEKHPQNTRLLYARALLHDRHNPDQMIQDLRLALSIDPTDPLLQNALGYSLTVHRPDELEQAYQLIRQALAQEPENPAILDSMGWVLFKLGDLEQALTYLERAWQLYPDPEVSAHLIRALDASQQRERALELLQQELDTHPDNHHLLDAAEHLGVTP